MQTQQLILNNILETAKQHIAKQGTFKAVFDLDSTLFDVNPRIRKILNDFGYDNAVQSRYPEAARVLQNVNDLKKTYKLKDQIIHMGLPRQPEEFYFLLMEFWKKHFFGNDYLKYDEPYEGAIEFVKEIHDLGAKVIYLTGRDVVRMGTGTEAQILQWNLPLGDRAWLGMKPSKEMDDALFKLEYLQKLPREGVEIWFFENEPANIELVLKDATHVKVIYFDSYHSETAEPPGAHIPRIISFSKK